MGLWGVQLTAWIGVMAGPQMLLASCLIDGNPLPAIQAAPIEAWLTVIYLGVVMTAIGTTITKSDVELAMAEACLREVGAV